MISPHDHSSSKSGRTEPDSPRDTSPANSYKTAKQEHQAPERLEYLKQTIVQFPRRPPPQTSCPPLPFSSPSGECLIQRIQSTNNHSRSQKSLRIRSFSCSIRIGKLKAETPRDDELIRALQKEADLIRGMVLGDEEEVKWLEAEIEKEQKERNDEVRSRAR